MKTDFEFIKKAMTEFTETCGNCEKDFEYTIDKVPLLTCPHCGALTPACSICKGNSCETCDEKCSGFKDDVDDENNI